MKTLALIIAIASITTSSFGADIIAKPEKPAVVEKKSPLLPGSFYSDLFVTAVTSDFKEADCGYGLGLGYQVNKNWAADIRIGHRGMDADDHFVESIGGRLVARMPFKFLSPYTFLGGTFDLERDSWRIQPGAGLEFTPLPKWKGFSVFAEGALSATTGGRNDYLFGSGLRWRF